MNTSITSAPFLAALGTLTLGVIVAGIVVRSAWRWLYRAASVGLVLTCGLAGINSYFDYVPTVAALAGRRAADQASWRTVERRVVPPLGAAPAAIGPPTAGFHGLHASHAVRLRGGVTALPATGSVVMIDIAGGASGIPSRRAQVYLPPVWFQQPHPRLPVIELLHGTPGMPEDWTRGGYADQTADRWAAANGGFAPILVMPDVNGAPTSDTECVNGRAGNVETYLTVDVRDAVVSRFDARGDGASWIVGGLSEGGYCAAMLALRHPQQFAAFLDFGGDAAPTHTGGARELFTGTPAARTLQVVSYTPTFLLARLPPGPRPAAWFEVGVDDGSATRACRELAAQARSAGLDTRLVTVPGAHHTFRVWHQAFVDALPWAVGHLSGTPASSVAALPPRGSRHAPPSA